jgi:hypothetical protein
MSWFIFVRRTIKIWVESFDVGMYEQLWNDKVGERFAKHSVYFDMVEMCFVCSRQIDIRQNASLLLSKFVGIISKYYYLIFNGSVDNSTVAVWIAAGSVRAVT